MPTTTATAAPRMTRKSHHGTPRIGTGLLRNGKVFFTVIGWVCGPMIADDGVTTTSYGPSASPDDTASTPRKNPSPCVTVVFDAMTAAPCRNSIVRPTPATPVFVLASRTYPVTLSDAPGSTRWPAAAKRRATLGWGGWTCRACG